MIEVSAHTRAGCPVRSYTRSGMDAAARDALEQIRLQALDAMSDEQLQIHGRYADIIARRYRRRLTWAMWSALPARDKIAVIWAKIRQK